MLLCHKVLVSALTCCCSRSSTMFVIREAISKSVSKRLYCVSKLGGRSSLRKPDYERVVRLCFAVNIRYCTKHSPDPENQPGILVHILKWGILTILVTTVLSTTVVWWEVWMLRHNMSSVTSSLIDSPVETRMPEEGSVNTQNIVNRGGVWFPWIQSKSQDPFMVLELCRSDNSSIRRLGVKALAAKDTWEDYQYRYVAQAADHVTLIGLSRSHGVDSRFFLPEPSLVAIETPVVEELASVLLALDQQMGRSSKNHSKGDTADTAAALAQQHLQRKHKATDDKSQFWGFDGSSLDVASVDGPLPEEQLLMEFLRAVAQLCCIPDQASLFVEKHGLAILQRITEQYANTEIFTAVAAVLGNLALQSDLHEKIVHTGWLGKLRTWSEAKTSKLAVNAARVLSNLDTEWSTDVLEDGIMQLHPLHRSRKTVHADVILVHGLRGGGIKTWRQKDRDPGSIPSGDDNHSDCWPKDWLANDCPHVRILSVHYDTALSSWSSKNVSKEKCTLEGRGREILDKLRKAGVGSRPVIWVGHSMGGLLIKQMLALCEEGVAQSPLGAIRQQTSGLLLYSVPHHGLSLAALTNQAHYLLFPSIEVQELSSESSHLRRIHENFKQFVETNNIPCLNFGEERKTKFRKTLPKILLVPAESSDPGVGEFCTLPLDHISICKPESRDSEVYQRSLAFLHKAIFFSYVHRFKQAVAGTLD